MNFKDIREMYDSLKAAGADNDTILATIEEKVTEHYTSPAGQDEIANSPHPDITVQEAVDIVIQTVNRWLKE